MPIFNHIILIDPAGQGTSGLVLVNIENWNIVANESFQSPSETAAVRNFNLIFQNWKTEYKNKLKPFVIIEDFFLGETKITNPLSTPKAIQGIITLLEFIYNWPHYEQHPKYKNKKNYNYKGSIKLTNHEHDSYKQLPAFIERMDKLDVEWLPKSEKDYLKKQSLINCKIKN